jgi:hypothetical protein
MIFHAFYAFTAIYTNDYTVTDNEKIYPVFSATQLRNVNLFDEESDEG